MNKRLIYKWYWAVCLVFISLWAQAQYSEEDLLKEATALFEQGKYADAMPLYSQLLSLNPTNPDFNYHYGATALYGDASKKEEAIKFLRYASTKDGIDPKCWYFLGRAYHLNYQFADAIKSYNKYLEVAPKKEFDPEMIERELESCRNGQNLLSNIKDVVVLDKKQSAREAFFRIYDLTDIGGKILVTPEELLSPLDVKNGHKSLIHFRGTGTVVYFSSYGKDGKNGLDIYRASVLPNGSFTEPERLGGFVNTPFDEDYPFLHPDDKTFYFSSKGHSSMGGYDIFQSSYDAGLDVFSQPVNLDFAVNTPDDELLYIADSAKQVANFASARSSEQGQLHVYKVNVYSAPVDLTLIKGTFDNEVDSKDNLAKITVIDASTNRQIDVQYTDPVTGEYLLSFPRSGKFKFLVEASNSEQIHAGIVEIPSSSGVNAYLQEMDLVSSAGAEKLLINNLFDQLYQGDIAELAQKLLKQKAALDVNFDPETAPIPEPAAEEEQELANAASNAGFPAGLSNEAVLEQAIARNGELQERQDDIAELQLGAVNTYNEKSTIASQKSAELKSKLDNASQLSGDERGKAMFEAGLLKMQAEAAILEAQNARVLNEDLDKLAEDVSKTLVASEEQSQYLKESLESDDYETAFNALKTEKAWEENNSSAYTNYDVLDLTQTASIDARNEAQSYLERAGKLRSDAEELENKLVTRRRQRELAKGKRAKELDAEIAQLETEYQDVSEAADAAFTRAEKFEDAALDKRQQYEIVVDLTESLLDGSLDLTGVSPDFSGSTSDLDAISAQLEGTNVDNAAVADYLAKHPEAVNQLGDDMAVMAFKKQYTVPSDDLASNTNEPATEETEAGIAGNETEVNDVAMSDSSTEPSVDGESTESENAQDSSQSNSSDIAENNELNNSTDGGGSDATSAAGTGTAATATPVVVDENSGSDQEGEEVADNSNVSSEESGESQAATEIIPEEPTLEDYVDMSNAEMIAADQEAITAAEDWIAIIDSSIDELESSEGSLTDSEQDQLNQYTALKATKEMEIAARQERISTWQAEEATLAENTSDSTNENVSESTAEALSENNQSFDEAAIAEALEDVESLDANYTARLESKIESTFNDRRYMGQIHSLNSAYLGDMSVVELSGKSDPEIAADRMELNAALIEEIDAAMQDFSKSQDQKDMLLELRRIKALEIKQDQEIQAGELAYQPRTAEGQDLYAQEEAERIEREMYDPSDIEGLSPEMKADLSVSYSRDLVLGGYNTNLKAIENSSSEKRMKEERLELNNAYLTALQDEIDLYSEAVKEVEDSQPNAVTKRYEELLAERSAVIDEINTDKTYLAFAEAAAIAEGRDPDAEEEEPVPDYVSEFEQTYTDELAAVKAKDLPEVEAQRELAKVNANVADGIDLAIETLTLELDETESESRRDALQQEIQSLDAIAADKRQEADRLIAYADELEMEATERTSVASLEEETNVENNAAPTIEPELDVEELRAQMDLEPVDLNEVNYKSLNANIALNTMKPLVVSTNEKKSQAYELLNAYQETEDPAERQAIAADLIELQKEITVAEAELTKELAKSNEPEIAFFQSENAELMSTIQFSELDVVSDSKKADYAETGLSIQRRLEENNRRFESGQITEAERVQAETELLGELASLNSELTESAKLISEAEVSTSLAEQSTAQEAENVTDTGEMTEEEASLYSDRIPSSMQFLLRDPENLLAQGANEYVSPVLEAAYENMTSDQIEAYQNEDENLVVESDFIEQSGVEEEQAFLQTATTVDARGIKLLASSPDQMDYLLAAVKADSIAQLEKAQADYANEMVLMSSQELGEVRRLREAALAEQDASKKEEILVRAARIEIDGVKHYEKGAIAAKRAEELRIMRQGQERILAEKAALITYQQKAELDAILDHETYKIIPSDLASNEPSTPREKTATERPSVETESTTTTSTPEGANWLEMVEVVAEKTDFSDVEETMFIQVDAPVYSDRRPIPIDPEMPDGLIFQVQIGAFRNAIPQDLFSQFAPVMGQKLDNGITRYRAGIFREYRKAVEARDVIRSNGYSDAFVVVYLDGEKLSGAQVQDILAQAQTAIAEQENANTSVATNEPASSQSSNNVAENTAQEEATGTVSPDEMVIDEEKAAYYNDPEAAEAAQVEVTPGLFYTVQVGVYSKPVKLDALYNLTELNSELTASGVIRYTTGRFATVQEASARKTVARDKGVSDAFVTAYYNGKRISLDEAARIIEENGSDAISPSVVGGKPSNTQGDATPLQDEDDDVEEGVVYVVILGTFFGDVPQELANIFLERDDIQIRRVDGPNGSSIYVSPEFTSRSEADQFLKDSKDAGIRTAVMGTMKDGNIVSLN